MKEISLNILDIVQNSIRAGAKNIRLEIIESDQSNSLVIKIVDDGSGMDKDTLARIDDPYTTSRKTRKVGMGIPLLKYHAEITGGSLKISSIPGEGTEIFAGFKKDHIDRQPMGDICGVLKLLLMAEKEIDFEYHHTTDEGNFSFSSREAKSVLEVEDFSDFILAGEIYNLLKNNLLEIGAEFN
jgi:hypothetical protein